MRLLSETDAVKMGKQTNKTQQSLYGLLQANGSFIRPDHEEIIVWGNDHICLVKAKEFEGLDKQEFYKSIGGLVDVFENNY